MQKHACFVWALRDCNARAITKFLLVMKLTTAILLIFLLNASANGISQTITFNGKNVPLEKVIPVVEKQANVFFFYEAELLKLARPVSISASNQPVSEFLSNLFKDQPLDFHLENRLVVVTRKKELAFPVTVTALPNNYEAPPPVVIRGKVTGDNGEPVEASVVVKGSTAGTTTDANGFFQLTLPTEKATLVISGVNIEPTEVLVDGSVDKLHMITVSTRIIEGLETVVTGYSSQRKKDVIGSVAVVDVKTMKSIPTGSALQALQGQASGVNIISTGSPGYSSNIRIRGVTSFGNTNPLVLIDGVQGNLNDIPSDDVESIQVLKDAGAAAIYGVRGANGVIIVTTRKGKAGRFQTTYDSYVGVQTPVVNDLNMMDPDEYMATVLKVNPDFPLYQNGVPDFTWRGPGGMGAVKAGAPEVDPIRYVFDPSNPGQNYLIQSYNREGTDWFKQIFKPALMTNHNLTTSGGTEKLTFLLSLGYLNQQGTLVNTHLKRYSIRVNTEYKLRKNIRIGENLYVFYKDNPQENPNNPYTAISYARSTQKFIPVYDIMGNWGGGYAGPGMGTAGNPYALRVGAANNRAHTLGVTGNLYAEADFLKDFTIKTNVGVNASGGYSQTYTPFNYFHAEQFHNKNALSEYAGYGALVMWTNTLNYKKRLDKHFVNALVGTEAISMNSRNQTSGRQGFYSEDYSFLVLSNGTTNVTNTSAAAKETFFSMFGRVDYSFDDKYLLGLTLRRDGSSRFGPDKRYGFFPSVTAGWRLSNEKFLQDATWINDLKLRASHGVIGNSENVSVWNAATLYSQSFINSYYDINGTGNSIVQGFIPNNLGNPAAGWEKNIVTNIGLDATLFANKLDFSVEYFDKRIEGLLFGLPLPTTIAGTAARPTVNIGDIKNNGIDANAVYHARFSKNAKLDIGVTFTKYKNMIKRIPDPGYFDPSWTPGNSVRNQEGHAVGSFFGYQVVGLFRDQNDVDKSPTQDGAEPGRFKYMDVNGDGVINTADRTFIGNPNPDFVYGLNLGFTYKGFDIGAVFYGTQGNDIWNETLRGSDFFPGTVNKSRRLLNAWTPENPDTNIPKLELAQSFSTTNVPNTYFIEDGSYLRMRSLVLGYNFNAPALSNIGISKLRLYVQGSNLFTITKYSGTDPEITSYRTETFGIDEGYYPNSRNFLIGINVGF